jgi:hypothetical protein
MFIWAPCGQLYSLAETPRSPPPHLGSYTRVLLVRRHLFVTPSNKITVKNCGSRLIHLSLPEASNLHLAFGRLIDLSETPCRKTSLGQGDYKLVLVARLLATAALWVRIYCRYLSKTQNGRHKKRSGQHTLASQKIYKKTSLDTTNVKRPVRYTVL